MKYIRTLCYKWFRMDNVNYVALSLSRYLVLRNVVFKAYSKPFWQYKPSVERNLPFQLQGLLSKRNPVFSLTYPSNCKACFRNLVFKTFSKWTQLQCNLPLGLVYSRNLVFKALSESQLARNVVFSITCSSILQLQGTLGTTPILYFHGLLKTQSSRLDHKDEFECLLLLKKILKAWTQYHKYYMLTTP